MKPPIELVTFVAFAALAVSSFKGQILTIHDDPAAAWWVIVDINILLALIVVKKHWYRDVEIDANHLAEVASPAEQRLARVHSSRLTGGGFAFAAVGSGLVFAATSNRVAAALAIGSLALCGSFRWWLPKLAAWLHWELKFVAALSTMYWVMIVVSAVIIPWWGSHG